MLGEETVTVVRSGGATTRFGDPLPGTEFDVTGCMFAPLTGIELLDQRDTVVVQPTLYAPLDADIRSTDSVRIRGEMFTVDGGPAKWGTSSMGGLQIPLRRAIG